MHLTRTPWTLVYAATFALPAVLLFASVRTFREMDSQREVYLRNRAAAIASRLDAAGAQDIQPETQIPSLLDGEPHLLDLRILTQPGGSDPGLEAVWSGAELFHTQFLNAGPRQIFRAYVPVHVRGAMSVAQIDLDSAASDFLLIHPRHNVIISTLGGIVLILISWYSIWAAKKTAQLERHQLELQNLAQLGTMSAVLAHEIRNPLGTIKGFAQLAREQAGPAVEPLLTPIVDQTLRIESLVNDLLIYGRPPSPVFQSVAWTRIAESLRTAAERIGQGRTVPVTIAPADIDIETDPNLLEHVLINLLRNAIDAVEGRPNPKVAITAVPHQNRLVISVTDNGPGIPDVAKVTEPFFTTKTFGTGLGIPISIKLAKSLHGELQLLSPSAGGTAATIALPLGSTSNGTDSHRR